MSDNRIFNILETFNSYHLSVLAITTVKRKTKKKHLTALILIFISSSFAHNAVNVCKI